MDDVKALRGLWGANMGPKMSQDKKQARKIAFVNLAANNENQVKGWKAHR